MTPVRTRWVTIKLTKTHTHIPSSSRFRPASILNSNLDEFTFLPLHATRDSRSFGSIAIGTFGVVRVSISRDSNGKRRICCSASLQIWSRIGCASFSRTRIGALESLSTDSRSIRDTRDKVKINYIRCPNEWLYPRISIGGRD